MARTENPASSNSFRENVLYCQLDIFFTHDNHHFDDKDCHLNKNSKDVHLVEVYPVWVAPCVSDPMQIEHCRFAPFLLIILSITSTMMIENVKIIVTSVGSMCQAAIFGESGASVRGMSITL